MNLQLFNFSMLSKEFLQLLITMFESNQKENTLFPISCVEFISSSNFRDENDIDKKLKAKLIQIIQESYPIILNKDFEILKSLYCNIYSNINDINKNSIIKEESKLKSDSDLHCMIKYLSHNDDCYEEICKNEITSFHLFNSRLTRNHNLFRNYRLQVHVIENDEESKDFEKLNNIIDTILIIYTMKRYTIENYQYSKMSKQIKSETCSTIYHKNDEVTIYTNLTGANHFSKSINNNILSEEESIHGKEMKFEVSYFLELPIQKFVNPDTIINLARFHSNISLLRINSERMYIDLRDSSYYKSLNQNIKMLILNVNKIYGFNSMENYEGYFEVDEEFKQIDFCPAAYSLFIFLVLTRLIYSLDIIWISSSLKFNRGELNIFINKCLDNTKKISINEFDAFKLDNFDDKISKSDSAKCQKEFIFNTESKNKYEFMVDKLDTKNVNQYESKSSKFKIFDPNKKKKKNRK